LNTFPELFFHQIKFQLAEKGKIPENFYLSSGNRLVQTFRLIFSRL